VEHDGDSAIGTSDLHTCHFIALYGNKGLWALRKRYIVAEGDRKGLFLSRTQKKKNCLLCTCVLTVPCHMRSGVESSTCGVMLVSQMFDFGVFLTLHSQIRDFQSLPAHSTRDF
jgi:hypothetical protein